MGQNNIFNVLGFIAKIQKKLGLNPKDHCMLHMYFYVQIEASISHLFKCMCLKNLYQLTLQWPFL